MAPKNSIDARRFLKDNYGVEVLSRNAENGDLAKVRDSATGEESELDVGALMRDIAQGQGINPAEVSFELSNADMPFEESALSFVDKVKYATTRTEKDKTSFLTQEFGAGNVKKLPDGRYSVKKGQDWNVVEDSFMGSIAAEGGVIGGSILGAKAGAAIGTGVLPGPGTAIGGVLGAGIGAALGKFATLDAAEEAGLRTEDDAAQVAKEVGIELVLGMGGELIVPAARLAKYGTTQAYNRAIKNIAGKLSSPAAFDNMAGLIQKTTGIPYTSVRESLESPAAVEVFQNNIKNWSEAGRQTVDPATQALTSRFTQFGTMFKKKTMNEYGKELAQLSPELNTVTVDLSDTLAKASDFFTQSGMVDETGKFVGAKGSNIAENIDPGTLNAFKAVHGQLSKLAQQKVVVKDGLRKNFANFEETQKVVRSLQGLLETSGHYNMKGEAVASQALNQIEQLKLGVQNAVIDSASKKNPDLAKRYLNMQSKYSERISNGAKIFDRLDPSNVKTSVNKYLNHDMELEPALDYMMKDLGINPEQGKKLLRQPRAAMDTWTRLNQKRGAVDQLTIPGMLAGAVGASSPKFATKMTGKTLNHLRALGKASEFVGGMTPAMRDELLSQPSYLRALEQSVIQSGQIYDQTQQQLLAPLQGGGEQGGEGM